MSHVLGIDAGNTKTIALIATLDGRIVGHGRSGCGDMYGSSEAAAFAAHASAARMAGLGSDIAPERLRAVVLCAAGADWPEDHHAIREAFAPLCGVLPTVYNDAFGGLRAGTSDGIGVVVQCGTGAAVGACGHAGQRWHSGFWIDAYGGGALGAAALQAVKFAALGHAPATQLTEALLAHYRAATPEALLHLTTARGNTAAAPRTLAPLVMAVAAAGDAVARAIVNAQARALGDYAITAARNTGLVDAPFPLVLSGGVLRNASDLLRDGIVTRVCASLPGAQPVINALEPAIGALMLALEQAGVPVDAALLAALRATAPAAAVFATD